tara:strand:+ start:864 stop:1187 length:324 start_codon:yes stop_codon:yes gene_type:complete
MSLFYNITGSTGVTVELLKPNEGVYDTKKIIVTNVHASADATVTLFIENDPDDTEGVASQTYNIIHTVAVPADSSLLLDENFLFEIPNDFGLYITVGSTDTVDVILG